MTSERELPKSRPTMPLAVLLALSLAVWVAGLWRPAPDGPPPDALALELRRFRTLTDDGERAEAIQRFGKVQDPRVVVVLMEVVQEERAKKQYGGLMMLASSTVVYHHMPKEEIMPVKYWTCANMWWEKNEAEVRRRAAAIPQ